MRMYVCLSMHASMCIQTHLVVRMAVQRPESGSAQRQVPVYPVCMNVRELIEPQL